MNAQVLRDVVAATADRLPPDAIQRLETVARTTPPPDRVPAERIVLRKSRLAEADVRPSRVAFERILGRNDLLDVNYLSRALRACRAVCRIVLRDRTGRETGYGTGFLVSPGAVLTNHHVLPTGAHADTALAEFDHELDDGGLPRATTRFRLDPRALFLADETLDFALVAVDPQPAHGLGQLGDYGFLRVNREVGKVNPSEFVTIVQHPGGQPKQIALRENRLLAIEDLFLHYQSDTAQGSSGAPVLNDSWQLVALHHSGVPRRDDQGHWLRKDGTPAGPEDQDADIDWIANEGVRASRIALYIEGHADRGPRLDEFLRAAGGEIPLPRQEAAVPAPSVHPPTPRVEPVPGGAVLTLPVQLTVTLGTSQPALNGTGSAPAAPLLGAEEATRVPYVDPDYDNRTGYAPDFLGHSLPLPALRDPDRAARTADGDHVLPYVHFSAVVDRPRRLALFTASNIDGRPDRRRPESGRDYSRKGLSGLGKNDREAWLTDPRIPEAHQLPDRFYTRDGGAFDKGHVVRRDDVCWGGSYDEVRRANGDTFHTTNCSPQVAHFNRSNLGGLWGRLENEVLRQADDERLSVFAGPVLDDGDRVFHGRDHRGPVAIQIPQAYWKVVVAREGDRLNAYAFVLEQDLADVDLEFDLPDRWRPHVVSVADLEDRLELVVFPQELHEADRAADGATERLVQEAMSLA
jgi:endonuclease G